jgi:hypothetical protein
VLFDEVQYNRGILMIFNDYVIGLNEQKERLDRIDFIIKDVESILELHEIWVNKCLSKIYLRKIHNGTTNYAAEANALTAETTNHINKIRENLICIDFLEYGEILSDFRGIEISGFLQRSIKLSDSFKESYKIIHKYKKLTDNAQKVDQYNTLIEAMHLMKNTYNNFRFMVECLNDIDLGLNRGIESAELFMSLVY